MHIPLYKYFSELPWIPVIPIYGYTALRIKALTSEEVLVNSSRHLEILDLYAQELNTDAILPLLDLTVEAEVLGAEVSYPPHDAPIIKKHAELEVILEGYKYTTLKMSEMLKLVRKMVNFHSDKIKGFYVTGPFTVLTQAIGVEKTVRLMIREHSTFRDLMEKCTELCKKYLVDLQASGIDFIIIADPSSALLSSDQFESSSKPFLEELLDESRVDVILHICGKIQHLIDQVIKIKNLSGVSVDQNISLRKLAEKVPKDFIMMGNYNPLRLAEAGQEDIQREAVEMVREMINYPNFVASTGCEIPSVTPIHNIKKFIQACKIKRF
jgi:uroporphyrinogen decarboxylase